MVNARIRVKRLVNLGNFEHLSIETEQDCRGPRATKKEMADLVDRVNEQAWDAKKVADAQFRLYAAEDHLEAVKTSMRESPGAGRGEELEQAQADVKKAKQRLAGFRQRLRGSTLKTE